MAQCDFCGKEISAVSAFTCNYCGKTFCPEHRLPFNHACTGIEKWKKSPPPGKKGVSKSKKREKGLIPEITQKQALIAVIVIILLFLFFYFVSSIL